MCSSRIYKIFFSLLFCFAIQQAFAGGRGEVILRLTDSVLEVRNEELKDVTIAIENKGSSVFRGNLHLYCGKGARVATKQDMTIEVQPGKSLFVSAKVYIGGNTPAGKISYSAQLSDQQRNSISEVSALLHLGSSRIVQASLPETELIMPAAGHIMDIPVQVKNKSNVPQEVNLVIVYPTDLHDQSNKSIRLTLPPFSDTILHFTRKVTRSMINLEYMDITAYGVFTNGDYFSMASGSVQRIRSKKKFGRKTLNGYGERGANFVSLGAQNAFSSNESYFLQAKGDYAVGKTNVAFSLNMYKWKNPGMPTLINDTWLAFEYKGAGIKVGNIIQSGELSYNGRGVSAFYYTDSLKRHMIYAGYLDKSFNLFNNQGSSTSFGSAAWAGYTRESGQVKSNTMLSFDQDKYAGTKSALLVNDALWRISDLLFAAGKIGIANSASSNESKESHQSYSVSGSLSGSLTKALAISSDNLYASGYYPGTRRGTLSLNERLSLRLGKTTIGTGYMYNFLNPKYFAFGGTAFRNNNKGSTAELSAARPIGSVNLAIAAQYYHEEGNWYYNGATLPGNTDAIRLSMGGSFASRNNLQNIMLKADIGKYRANVMQGDNWQLRANLSYVFLFSGLRPMCKKETFISLKYFSNIQVVRMT